MRRVWFFIILVAALSGFVLFETERVMACSGPTPPSTYDEIDRTAIIVKAQPVEIDDAQVNGILRVETYLSGGPGAEFIFFKQSGYALINGVREGYFGNGGDCIGLGARLQPNLNYYLFLQRADSGTYFTYSRVYSFHDSDTSIQITADSPDDPDQRIQMQVTEAEFVNLIMEHKAQTPTLPIENSPYPMKAQLEITTSTGTTYQLPVDGAPPVEIIPNQFQETQGTDIVSMFRQFSEAGTCSTEGCLEYSANGLNIAIQTNENTITRNGGYASIGQAFLFSPTSDAIAIWNEAFLSIERIPSDRIAHYPIQSQELQVGLHGNSALIGNLAGKAAWTPDGRLLAYSDAEGLWLWDALTLNAQPRLLLATSEQGIPFARFFSAMGRYIAVTQGNLAFNLDTISGRVFPDGLVSPDERLLLAFDSQAETFSAEICALIFEGCTLVNEGMIVDSEIIPGSDEPIIHIVDLNRIRQIEWRDSFSYIVFACNDDLTRCGVWEAEHRGRYMGTPPGREAIGYVYDHENDELALLVDRSTIVVGGQRHELGNYLDGDIVSIEWGESLFYHE